MIVVAGNNAINLENISRLSLGIDNLFGWEIMVTFGNPTKYYSGFIAVSERDHPRST